MNIRQKLLFTLFSMLLGFQAYGLERTEIAENANDVTPLLNGAQIPNIQVKLADGSPVSLQALFLQKPSVIIFYRGGWCPYCSRQLADLRAIEADLVEAGYQILAISPETPEKLKAQKLETEFDVTLVSDADLNAIRAFGIGFYVEDTTRRLYKDRMNVDLTPDDTDRAVLPAPAVYIVNQQGKVLFNYVNPDYKTRPSAALVLSAAQLL